MLILYRDLSLGSCAHVVLDRQLSSFVAGPEPICRREYRTVIKDEL